MGVARLKHVAVSLAVSLVLLRCGTIAAHAEGEKANAGWNNPCLERWMADHNMKWTSQEYTHNGDHMITFEGGVTVVEHPNGSVQTVRPERDQKSGEEKTVYTDICGPKTSKPPAGAGGTEQPKTPTAPGKLSPADEANLKCATDDEIALVQSYRRSIDGFQRELDTIEKPTREADEAFENEKIKAAEVEAEDTSDAERKAANAEAHRLGELAKKAHDAVKDRVDQLNGYINDTDGKLHALLDEIGKRTCPPKGHKATEKKRSKRGHARRAPSEDDPRYMENYRAPSTGASGTRHRDKPEESPMDYPPSEPSSDEPQHAPTSDVPMPSGVPN